MRWLTLIVLAFFAGAIVSGCGGGSDSTSPAPVVGSYLGDAFMTAYVDPVANLGLVVRDNRTVEGAAFFSAPLANYDSFFSGSVDASNRLSATGRLYSTGGTIDVGAFTITATFGNFTDGSNIHGTFTADTIGTGEWRGYIYTTFPLGAYVGTYSGDLQGRVALMIFRTDDTVMMIERSAQPYIDYFASDLGSLTLSPPTQAGGPYGLTASNGLYGSGFGLTGTVGQTEATGAWDQAATPTPLTGTWTASKPVSRGAVSRGVPPGPLRVHRSRR